MTSFIVSIIVVAICCILGGCMYKVGYEDGKQDGIEYGTERAYLRARSETEEAQNNLIDLVEEFGIKWL